LTIHWEYIANTCLTIKKVKKSSCHRDWLSVMWMAYRKSNNQPNTQMKKLIAIVITSLTISAQAWDGGCAGGYYGGGYNPAPAVQSYQMGRYYQSGGYGGWNGGGCGGYGAGWGAGYGNSFGQWGNGQGATLNGVAAIIGALAPILAQPQQQVIVRQGY
jgi:hypothetical protein